jgi:hypothetical protein
MTARQLPAIVPGVMTMIKRTIQVGAMCVLLGALACAETPSRESPLDQGGQPPDRGVEIDAIPDVAPIPDQPRLPPSSPLAGRPSKPGPHVKKIEALGDNAWLDLGKPAPDATYGAARGRTWSRKMAFAPDLRGAFLYGEGVHGGSSERGGAAYYNDDLFFYDINAHAWVCCHPGTPLVDPGLHYDDTCGCERDKNNDILPVAVSVHGYWTPEYDTHRKMFTMVPAPASLYWVKALGKHRPYIVDKSKPDPRWGGYGSAWYWDPATGKWEFRRVHGPAPKHNVDNVYFYSRKLKKGVNIRQGVWLYDHATNSWTKASETGGGNGAYCYDPKREWIYAVQRDKNDNNLNKVSIYDIVNESWSKPTTTGDAGSDMESNQAFFTFDTANDVAVLHIQGKHHVYSPTKLSWEVLPDTHPDKTVKWGGSGGFYDEQLNAHFYFNAGDSKVDPGHMWVYRYKANP